MTTATTATTAKISTRTGVKRGAYKGVECRTSALNIRCSPDFKTLWTAHAAAVGLTLSDFVEQACNDKIRATVQHNIFTDHD